MSKTVYTINTPEIEEKIQSTLKNAVELRDAGGGTFEYAVYKNYNDRIDDAEMNRVLESDDPREAFQTMIEESYNTGVSDFMYETTAKILHELNQEFAARPDVLSVSIDDVLNYLYDNISVSYPTDDFLSQTFCSNVMIDTGDGNYDFVLNNFWPHYDSRLEDELDSKASLVWLAGTQGYGKDQLEVWLKNKHDDAPKFIKSIYSEVQNASSHMNVLTFLIKLTAGDLLNMNEFLKNSPKSNQTLIKIEPGTPCGLYDPWSGAGSLFEIELEKEIQVPVKFVRSILVDPQRSGLCGTYSIHDAYGVNDRFWDKNTPKKED